MSERVLWVEDNPELFKNIADLVLPAFDINPVSFFDRITFAHDFASAEQALKQPYDLAILDADFPDVTSPARYAQVTAFLDAVRNGNYNQEIEMLSAFGRNTPRLTRESPQSPPDMVSPNNFFLLYQELLKDTSAKTVVCSSSRDAPALAFALNLPFYTKGSSRSRVERDVRGAWDRGWLSSDIARTVPDVLMTQTELDSRLSSWECGDLHSLVGMYFKK